MFFFGKNVEIVLFLCSINYVLSKSRDTEEWEDEFVDHVARQYGGYHENGALIVKSKLYYWTEEDKINLCFNISKEIDPDTLLEDLELKNDEAPAVFEKMVRFRAKDVAKRVGYSFWYLETVRCPIKDNTFYIHESVRRDCYFFLVTSTFSRGMIHISDEFCPEDVTVLNRAL